MNMSSGMNRMGSEGQERTDDTSSRSGDTGGDLKKQVTETASHLAGQAREAVSGVASKAGEAMSRVGEKISSMTGTVREQVAGGTEALRSAAGAVSSQWEAGTDYLREHDLSDLTREASALVRRHPLPAMLAVFGLGLLLGSTLRR
jgi:hypothetical protein